MRGVFFFVQHLELLLCRAVALWHLIFFGWPRALRRQIVTWLAAFRLHSLAILASLALHFARLAIFALFDSRARSWAVGTDAISRALGTDGAIIWALLTDAISWALGSDRRAIIWALGTDAIGWALIDATAIGRRARRLPRGGQDLHLGEGGRQLIRDSSQSSFRCVNGPECIARATIALMFCRRQKIRPVAYPLLHLPSLVASRRSSFGSIIDFDLLARGVGPRRLSLQVVVRRVGSLILPT
jgi:hypothetical protein